MLITPSVKKCCLESSRDLFLLSLRGSIIGGIVMMIIIRSINQLINKLHQESTNSAAGTHNAVVTKYLLLSVCM